jgi:hypothetical protein
MKRHCLAILHALIFLAAGSILLTSHAAAKSLTYHQLDTVNLRDQGFSADERATHILITEGDVVYGTTSGERCHIFRFDPAAKTVEPLVTLDGPNTVMKGMVVDEDTIYVGTMLTPRQLWLRERRNGATLEFEEAHLIPLKTSHNTGHLYRISEIEGDHPKLTDLGVQVDGQGIHTLAIDPERQLIYGLTTPAGRFFIHDIANTVTETITFGEILSSVSDPSAKGVTVIKDLTRFAPGEVEFNLKRIAKAIHVMADGTLYTSGGLGQIIKYDPQIENPAERFTSVGFIPSLPGRQQWNRIDAIVERFGKLYMGTSDGFIIQLDPQTEEITNFGKPIRSAEVMGMAVSTLDGRLYGFSGGGLEGVARLWSYDLSSGGFEIDHPVTELSPNRRPIGTIVGMGNGSLVFSEANRTANLRVLNPGEKVEWEKSGTIDELTQAVHHPRRDERDRFAGHTEVEVEVYPIPTGQGGGSSGQSAIVTDREGKLYLATAQYYKPGGLIRLDSQTSQWERILSWDRIFDPYGRGQSNAAKVNPPLRLGSDGKILGVVPEGYRSDQFTGPFFSYDPSTGAVEDLGPGISQEDFAGANLFHTIGGATHPGETTPVGQYFMTAWDPDRLGWRDHEIVADEKDLRYHHPNVTCLGSQDSLKLYGQSDGDHLCEIDLDPTADGKFHVRRVCTVGLDDEFEMSMIGAMALGPEGWIYWSTQGGNGIPISLFAWDPSEEIKTYLGSCSLGGEWIEGGISRGLSVDAEGNLAVLVLGSTLNESQRKLWKTTGETQGQIPAQPYYYLNPPRPSKGGRDCIYYLRSVAWRK